MHNETAVSRDQRDAPMHLEDFHIGDRIDTGAWTITREQIRGFAEAYDPQPMHLDEKAGRESLFGGLVGSGWQTLALTMRLMVDARLLGASPIIGAEFQALRFHRPVRPGDTLRASAEVLALKPSRSRPERGFMDVRVTTLNQDGDPVLTQTWTLILPTRASMQQP